jgi:hypothetical protein
MAPFNTFAEIESMHEAFRLLVAGIVLLAPLPVQTTLQVGPFNSIEVPHGGHVVVQRAPTQRVSLVRGSLDYTRLTVADGGRLVIDKCFRKCPRGYRLELEILTPNVTGISLANGGSIQTRGGFPRQNDLSVTVSHGGTIDVRSMVANTVTASVYHGGRILTVPQASLSARVTQGGAITYWGAGQVRQSIEHGGVVQRGTAEEIDLPLSEIGPPLVPHVTKIGRER